MDGSFRKIPTTSARRLTSLFSRSIGIGAVQLGAVLAREGHVGQDVVLAFIHELCQLGPSRAELVGDAAPGFSGLLTVGLVEGLPDRGGNDGVLAARDMRQGVAHPVNAAALPGCFEHAFDGRPEAAVRRR